jgi:hypothetical protein
MKLSDAARYRIDVVSRVVAAIGGGYLLAAAATALLAVLLPTQRAEAVITATLLSFLTYASAVLWVFSTRSALRAWVGILMTTVLLAAALWLYRSMR